MTRRVLVVDDAAEMRLLIRRMLSARGYDVDLAETLAQARSLGPSGYDAVLIDAHLGPECGTDLVEWLRARNPAAAARCLIITGGAAAPLPDGVTCLSKPFGMEDLLAAVRAVEPAGGTVTPRQPGPVAPAPAPVQPPPPPSPAAHAAPAPAGSGRSAAWRLLGALARSRAAERRRLADFLHDGPIQELTAAVLELQLTGQPDDAGTAGAGHAAGTGLGHDPGPGADPDTGSGTAGPVLRRLEAVTGSLRWLVDRAWPDPAPPGGLAAVLQQRTAELLAVPATVEVTGQPEPAGPSQPAGSGQPTGSGQLTGPGCADGVGGAAAPGGLLLIADLVELMLTEIGAAGHPALAHVAVRLSAGQTLVELTLRPAAGQQLGDAAAAEASIRALAGALGAGATTEFSPGQWHARLTLGEDGA